MSAAGVHRPPVGGIAGTEKVPGTIVSYLDFLKYPYLRGFLYLNPDPEVKLQSRYGSVKKY